MYLQINAKLMALIWNHAKSYLHTNCNKSWINAYWLTPIELLQAKISFFDVTNAQEKSLLNQFGIF